MAIIFVYKKVKVKYENIQPIFVTCNHTPSFVVEPLILIAKLELQQKPSWQVCPDLVRQQNC